jgi:hypothetical protein
LLAIAPAHMGANAVFNGAEPEGATPAQVTQGS